MDNQGKQPTEDERMDQMLIDPYADIPSPLEKKKQTGNSPFQFLSIPLDGKLITEIDGTQIIEMDGERIKEGNFQVLQNMRYGELSPKSISGMTKVNTSTIYTDTPQRDYLIGWYKFDEGSGTVAANSAADGSTGGGLLPNLTVYNVGTDFWTALSGFGSSLDGAAYAWADIGSTRSYGSLAAGYACYGIFFRRSSLVAHIGGAICSLFNVNSDTSVSGTEFNADWWDYNNTYRHDFGWLGSTSITAYGDLLIDSWYFFFVDSSRYLKVVKPDGTLLVGTSAAIMSSEVTLRYLHAGVRYGDGATTGGYPANGSFGDWIVYNFKLLTLAEWAVWYDELRSRYSMSARSGW